MNANQSLLIVVLMLTGLIGFGQTNHNDTLQTQAVILKEKENVIDLGDNYKLSDDVAYKGGDKKMWRILAKSAHYPESALKDSISGIVYVYFTIDTCGRSTDIKVIRGVREDLDVEAIRCVDLLDDWKVGRCNGQKVQLHHVLPIKFSLTTVTSKRQ